MGAAGTPFWVADAVLALSSRSQACVAARAMATRLTSGVRARRLRKRNNAAMNPVLDELRLDQTPAEAAGIWSVKKNRRRWNC